MRKFLSTCNTHHTYHTHHTHHATRFRNVPYSCLYVFRLNHDRWQRVHLMVAGVSPPTWRASLRRMVGRASTVNKSMNEPRFSLSFPSSSYCSRFCFGPPMHHGAFLQLELFFSKERTIFLLSSFSSSNEKLCFWCNETSVPPPLSRCPVP